MDIKKLKNILDEDKQPAFRLKQILKEIYKNNILDFSGMTNLPKELRELLKNKVSILPFQAEKFLIAKDKKSAKALLNLADGNRIETVLISVRSGLWSVCASCQVGCPNNCSFCATGQSGFKRNLTAEEITDQVLFWRGFLTQCYPSNLANETFAEHKPPQSPDGRLRRGISGEVTNIVFMGMGEPFLNWENVKKSLLKLTDKDLFNFGDRSISVSTVGIPDGIKKIAKEFPQINLAISLHSAINEKRDILSPINKKYDLASIKKALELYLELTNRKVFIEYIMIEKINDNMDDAKELVSYLKSFAKSYLLHVNLIKYNETDTRFKSSNDQNIQKFMEYLLRDKVSVTVRRSLGAEIKGACGQLAGRIDMN